jgi:hypothetical protein
LSHERSQPTAGGGIARRAILSLGAGVQVTALALMAAPGELPLPEAAISADTGWESAATYAHLEWLTTELRGVLPVHVVRKEGRCRCSREFGGLPHLAWRAGERRRGAQIRLRGLATESDRVWRGRSRGA